MAFLHYWHKKQPNFFAENCVFCVLFCVFFKKLSIELCPSVVSLQIFDESFFNWILQINLDPDLFYDGIWLYATQKIQLCLKKGICKIFIHNIVKKSQIFARFLVFSFFVPEKILNETCHVFIIFFAFLTFLTLKNRFFGGFICFAINLLYCTLSSLSFLLW